MAYLGANSILKNTLKTKAKKDVTVPFSFCAKITRAIMKGNGTPVMSREIGKQLEWGNNYRSMR